MRSLLMLGCVLVATGAAAQPRPRALEALVRDSPFLPPDGAGPADSGAAQLEFRGVVSESGVYFFSVFDRSRNQAAWVRLEEPGRPFVVHRYDPGKDSLTVEYDHQILTLALKRAKVLAVAAAAPPAAAPPPLPTATIPAAPRPPLPAGASNPQEAERLMRIAEEIRRRRDLRQVPRDAHPPARP